MWRPAVTATEQLPGEEQERSVCCHNPPRSSPNLTVLRKMGQEGQLPCLESATGVAFVPLQEACLIIGIITVVIKKDTARKGFFTGFAVNSSYMFSCRFVCARECVDFWTWKCGRNTHGQYRVQPPYFFTQCHLYFGGELINFNVNNPRGAEEWGHF